MAFGREQGLVYLVSDLHLGDGSHSDIFWKKDDHFLAFLDEVEQRASTLLIVGDALDFEQAWSFDRIARAHPKVVSRLTRLSDHMRVIYVFGNHDPDVVTFRDIFRWQVCDKAVLDGHILAVHGYEFDEVLRSKLAESAFWVRALSLYETLFRTWIRLPLRDYYTLSNRAVHWGFYWLVRTARLLRWLAPRIGRPALGEALTRTVAFWTRGVLGDPMGLTRPVLDHLRQDDQHDMIVCGHSHVPGIVELEGGRRYVNLGSWSFGNSQYGIWDGRSFLLRDWISGREFGDENYRSILHGRAEWTYEEWFDDQYLGYLQFRCGEEALRVGVRPPGWVPQSLGAPALAETAIVVTQTSVAAVRGPEPIEPGGGPRTGNPPR